MPVETAVAERVDSFLRERIYTGTLVAGRRSELALERSGKIVELTVEEGDSVAKGQVLARLDTRRLTARRAQAEADVIEATAVLNELIAGPREETIAAAQAEVNNLSAQRDIAQRNLDRRAELVESRAVSREEYDEQFFLLKAAEARLDVAQKTLDELLAGTRIEKVDAQRARVAALGARLDDIDHELEDAELKAPYEGRVARRRLDEGAVVSVGTPVVDLVETGNLEAWIGLPPRAAATLSVGAEIEVLVDEQPFSARVRSLRPELDQVTRTQNVVLGIEQPDGLAPGQIVRVGLREPVAVQGFWVPSASLTPRRRGLWAVYVVDAQGVATARDVEVIEVDGDRSFIRGTLQAGERVIVSGAHRIVSGQRVASN